jgi:hypothetical protein
MGRPPKAAKKQPKLGRKPAYEYVPSESDPEDDDAIVAGKEKIRFDEDGGVSSDDLGEEPIYDIDEDTDEDDEESEDDEEDDEIEAAIAAGGKAAKRECHG